MSIIHPDLITTLKSKLESGTLVCPDPLVVDFVTAYIREGRNWNLWPGESYEIELRGFRFNMDTNVALCKVRDAVQDLIHQDPTFDCWDNKNNTYKLYRSARVLALHKLKVRQAVRATLERELKRGLWSGRAVGGVE